VREFPAILGFADKAFLSTTKDRDIALEYSGVKQGGVGTVLCIETSTTNNGAVSSSSAGIRARRRRSGTRAPLSSSAEFEAG